MKKAKRGEEWSEDIQTIKVNENSIVKIRNGFPGKDYHEEIAAYEKGRELLGDRNSYALDLNILRIPAFIFRNTPGKAFVEYEEERKIHGQKEKIVTKVGTLTGALTPFDYDLFRGICSFIRAEETKEGIRFSSCFTEYELLQKTGKNFSHYHKMAYDSLRKLPGLQILFTFYYYGKDEQPLIMTKPVNYFLEAHHPKKGDINRKHKFVFEDIIGKVFMRKYYRAFIWSEADKIADPIQKRLFEYLESELYGKESFNINFDRLAKRIPIQDRNKGRRQAKILKALNGLDSIFEHKIEGETLTIRKAKTLFQEKPKPRDRQKDSPKAAPGTWGSGEQLFSLWETWYSKRYGMPYSPSYKKADMKIFQYLEENYEQDNIAEGLEAFFTRYDTSRDRKIRYYSGKATPGHFRKFVIDKGTTAAQAEAKAAREKEELKQKQQEARRQIYERLNKAFPGEQIPDNITLEQIKEKFGERIKDDLWWYEYIFKTISAK